MLRRLYENLSAWAVHNLSADHFNTLRRRDRAFRKWLRPYKTLAFGTFGAAELSAHLEEVVGKDFRVLMVHSSIDGMTPMYTDGPLSLLRMLIDFCGPDRTLVMPAFFFGDPRYRGALDTFTHKPIFDVQRTPSQMGLLTELFRRTPGIRVSRHPVYRVSALGPLAGEITGGHELATTPTGRGTPFDAMARYDAKIVGIGKTYEVLTQVHHAEDVMGDAFPVPRGPGHYVPMTLVDGDWRGGFTFGQPGLKWRRRMHKLERIMSQQELRSWRYHGVPMFATSAGAVSEALLKAAANGLSIYDQQ